MRTKYALLPKFDEEIADDGNARPDNRIIGYVLKRSDCGEMWLFLGTTPTDILRSLAQELDGERGLTMDDLSTLILEPRLFTPKELVDMPEFEGW